MAEQRTKKRTTITLSPELVERLEPYKDELNLSAIAERAIAAEVDRLERRAEWYARGWQQEQQVEPSADWREAAEKLEIALRVADLPAEEQKIARDGLRRGTADAWSSRRHIA